MALKFTLDWIRTNDLPLRRRLLYPAELPGHLLSTKVHRPCVYFYTIIEIFFCKWVVLLSTTKIQCLRCCAFVFQLVYVIISLPKTLRSLHSCPNPLSPPVKSKICPFASLSTAVIDCFALSLSAHRR